MMSLIDHLSVGAPSIEQATKFYDTVLKTLGAQRLLTTDSLAAYGAGAVEFLVMLPFNREEATAGNGTHIAFRASDRDTVKAFYQAALIAGGTCEGKPGSRDGYPDPNVYTAYVRDPFGNKLEIIHNGFSN